jgi:hypothetical protein
MKNDEIIDLIIEILGHRKYKFLEIGWDNIPYFQESYINHNIIDSPERLAFVELVNSTLPSIIANIQEIGLFCVASECSTNAIVYYDALTDATQTASQYFLCEEQIGMLSIEL